MNPSEFAPIAVYRVFTDEVGLSTVARAEQGDGAVNFANIRKLAKAIGISPDNLLSDPDGGE